MSAPHLRPSFSRRPARGLAALAAAVAAVIQGSASAATVTLDGANNTQAYTPAATLTSGSVDTRTFTGQAVSDSSLINWLGTSNTVGTSSTLAVAAQASTTGTQFLGGLNVTTAGDYTFRLNTDDGSRLFIDGILVVNNEGGHAATNLSNVITLDAGRHEIRIDYVNNGGGGSIAFTYSGPDQPAAAAIPAGRLFRAENSALVSTTVAPHTTTPLGDDIIVTAGTDATITLNGTAYANAGLNTLALGAGSTLNLAGTANRDLRFGSTTFDPASTFTFDTVGDLSLGVASGTGSTIVKQGAGRLILDNTSAASPNAFTGSTFDVQDGFLHVVGSAVAGSTNPLGTAAIQLNGGTFSLDTALNNLTFNNAITLAGTGGTIQAVSGPRAFTLTSPLAIGAGQTLNLSTYSGSNNVSGSVLLFNSPLTGSGALLKTQVSAGTGTQNGNAILAANSAGFSGSVTVNGGILEGRFATPTDQPFGTTPVLTLAGGQLNLRGGSATPNLAYDLGTNVDLTGNATIDVNLYTGTAQGSTFALGTLTTTGARTFAVNSGNGYNLAFTNTVLGGNTTFNVTGGTLTPGPVTGNVTLTKTGAGTLNLGPANEFTGTATLSGGVVVAPVYSDTGPSSIGTGPVTLNGGTLRYTGADSIVTARTFSAANTAGGGLDISQAGTTFEITSAFAGNGGSSVQKLGAGTLIISGTTDNNSLLLNAQAGITELNKSANSPVRAVAGITNIAPGATVRLTGAGDDQIYGASITGNVAAVAMTGGTLDLNAKSESISRLNGSGTVTNNGAAGTTSVLTLGEFNGVGSFSGAIKDGVNGGKVAITKIGTGVATIGGSADGANTYTGATTISNGILRLAAVPLAPITGTSLWLDAADTATVAQSAGLVSAWNDKSGNNRHATQTNAANQPGYITNPLVGNQGVLDFAGAQKFLNVDLTFLTGTPYTIFALEGRQSNASNNYFIGNRGGANNTALHIGYRTDTQYTFAQFGNDITTAAGTPPGYNGTQIFRTWAATLNTSSGRTLVINGAQVGSNTSTTTLTVAAGTGVVGQAHNAATGQYAGDLGEIIIYNSALSAADRQAVEAYLNYKWFGIGAAYDVLPTTTAVDITASGAALDVNGAIQTIGSLSGVAGSAVTLGAGRLTVAGPDSTTFAGVISSSGAPVLSLVKDGAGTLTLSGANTYTGATRVEGGTLLVTGSLTGATIIDGSGAVLSGTGTLGATTLNNGTLTSGNATLAALATGDLTIGAGATLFELAPDGSSDSLNVTGTVNFIAPVRLDLSFDADLAEQTVFTLIANDSDDPFGFANGGGLIANGSPIIPGASFSYTSGAFTELFEVSYTGGDGNDLTLTVVPEPTAILSILGGFGLLLVSRRRKLG